MQFTVGSTPLTVTSLGRVIVAGNSAAHLVKLVRASDGVDVPGGSATVAPAGASGQFAYTQLPGPVTLQANTIYFLVSEEVAGGDQWYEYAPVTAANAVAVNGPAYWNGFTYTLVKSVGESYVPANLLYSTGSGTQPTVAITSPAAGATISGSSVTFSATATAASGLTILSVQFKVDNSNQGAAITNSPYNLQVDTTQLSNGAHTLTAVATDSANSSTTSAPVSITVNNVASSVAITAPSAGASVSGNNVTLSATATAGSGLSILSVQFKVDSTNVGAADTTSPYSTVLDATKLTNGSHTVTAVATDSANNTITSAPVSITVNNSATAVNITAPTAGATVSGNSVTVSATATAGTGLTISSVQFKVDNTNLGAAITAAPYSITMDATKLTNGAHSITAVATDSASNTVTSAPVSITVNNSATAVSVTAPAAGATVSGSNVTVSATATAGTGLTIANVQFKVDNTNLGSPVTASPYSTVLDTTKLTNGPHSLTAIATDSANNNVASAPVNITVNNAAPPPAGTPLVTSFTLGGPGNNFTGFVGMQFTVGASPLNVTALGRLDIAGNTKTHTVKLVRVSDGGDVPGGSATLSFPTGTVGQFAYATLVSPVTLQANTGYYLISEETSGGDQWLDLGPITTTNVVSLNGPVYYWPGFGYYLVGITNGSYVPVNLLYSGPSTGSPSTVAITAPSAGTTVAGNVTVSAAATAGTGLTISSVQFSLDGARIDFLTQPVPTALLWIPQR